ncbi:hypothetical protein MIR68_004676 [Amoeboaphelidium protococcarum]|nr:hypothetical protein MIR68_004676 [Amoeboaphelidium protococcarum]KAI3650168.1 hypothetical protein MP228_004980 [Amoeboaphelidium protococcarum]
MRSLSLTEVNRIQAPLQSVKGRGASKESKREEELKHHMNTLKLLIPSLQVKVERGESVSKRDVMVETVKFIAVFQDYLINRGVVERMNQN